MENTEKKNVLNPKLAALPIFDFKFKKVDWELNEENIEEHRDDIDRYGVIYVRAFTEDGDFDTTVIADCDIADGLYNAIDIVKEYVNDEWCEWKTVDVYYTTLCEVYGAGENYEHGNDFGYVLSSMLGCPFSDYGYEHETSVVCRASWDDFVQVWKTNEYGVYEEEIDEDVDALIENKK